jgi:hypothetical protein
VLGVFNNNTIQNCRITQCDSAFKLYAKYYVILRNDLENNNEAIRVGGIGAHFIAGNNIDNNKVGLTLYYSGSVIVQNNIAHCSRSAIILDNTGWNQIVYLNNFIGNTKCLTDYTYGNSPVRPVQSVVQPWDNGSKGNYWSDYNGTDRNHDGIGDTTWQTPTYGVQDTLSFYSYLDRYPFMTPQNIENALPPIPKALVPVIYSQTIPDNQAKALSFLKDVFQVDLNQYNVKLTSTQTTIEDATVYQTLQYSLYKDFTTSASASFRFSNTTLTSAGVYTGIYALLTTQPLSNSYDTAKTIIHNYQTWTHDGNVSNMVAAITAMGSAKNSTQVSGNISLSVSAYMFDSTYKWSYNLNGADYSSVILNMGSYGQHLTSLRFSDDRSVQGIGDTSVRVTEQQAIAIAEDYVKNNFTYLRGISNGSAIYVTGLGVVDQNTTAGLATTSRDSSTLYPYWEVRVALDHTYHANVVAVTVRVWADDGTVFSARTLSDMSSFPGVTDFLPFSILLSPFIFFLAGGLAFIVAVVVVLVIILRQTEKQQLPRT